METRVEPGWRFWLLIILFGGGAVLSLGAAFLLLLIGLLLATSLPGLPAGSAVSFLNLAFASGVAGVVMLLGLASLWRTARPAPLSLGPARRRLTLASLAMIVWLPLIGLIQLVETSPLAWLVLPPLAALAAIIPAWWLVEMARHGLDVLPSGRGWQLLAASLTLTIPLTLLLSLVMLLIFFVVLGVYLNSQPQLLTELQQLFESFDPTQMDMEQLQAFADQVLSNPLIVALLISLVAGATPLLEELLKPLALWLYAGDRLSPAQGFVGGALCGAAFGLWENLSALAGAMEGSGALILSARVGSLLLHITATAIFGWGLASYWGEARHLARLIGSYLLAVGLHAVWNLFGVLSAVPVTPQLPLINRLPAAGEAANPLWLALPVLALVNLLLLVWFNRRLQRQTAPAAMPASLPPAAAQPSAGPGGDISPNQE